MAEENMARDKQRKVVYVLGTRLQYVPPETCRALRAFYTGKKPTQRLSKAKTYDTREKAMNVRDFAKSGKLYHVMKTTRKRIFKAALEGK